MLLPSSLAACRRTTPSWVRREERELRRNELISQLILVCGLAERMIVLLGQISCTSAP